MSQLATMERFLTLPDCFSSSSVSELTSGKWIQAMPYSSFDHPIYGKVEITPKRAKAFKDNFDKRVMGQDIPINYEHFGMDKAKGFKAAAWIKEVEPRTDGFWWKVVFTEEAAKEVADGAWRYFSPEFYGEWVNPETQTKHVDVIAGGALTNVPFFKGMVPLNFSELLIAEHVDTKGEVADWEHSEPGTGVPREDDPKTDDAEGTRAPSPVIEPEDKMDEKVLAELRTKLGLAEDADESSILVAASNLVAEVTPLREAAAAASEKQTFADRFPQEFARMQALEVSDRENKAKAFADRFASKRVVEGEGDAAVTTAFGFSSATIENIEKMHLAFSNGELKQSDIEAVLESLMNSGLVDYSERGSSTDDASTDARPAFAFADRVAAIQTEDKVEYGAAIKLAAERYPAEFAAYRSSVNAPTTA